MAGRFVQLLVATHVLAGCGTTWTAADVDGDGWSAAQGDCWDLATGPAGSGLGGADIHPDATETWYDGTDQDCMGDNDFDVDGDGWVPTGFGGRATAGVPGSDTLPEGDCWDDPASVPDDFQAVPADLGTDADGEPYVQLAAAEVNPGYAAADDTWYDGIDRDCAGNDDFDQDGDGYRAMYNPDASGALGDDCLDGSWLDWDNAGGAEPAQVNLAAEEDWYSGTDDDCDLDLTHDCDQDGDDSPADPDGRGFCEDEDCNDLDAGATPTDVPEVYYNGIDDNCDFVDEDGDADDDGWWAEDYEDLVAAGGYTIDEATVRLPDEGTERDCWDDPDTLTDDFTPVNGLDALDAAEVYPGAPDRHYDGVDQDCSGGDDFDWDGDGDASEYWPDRDGHSGGDCIDCDAECEGASGVLEDWCQELCAVEDDNPAGLDPTAVNSDVIEDEPYDDTDADCLDDSDWDNDRDGYDSIGRTGGTDCIDGGAYDEANPASLSPEDVNPGATEAWYDGTDQDCNGLSDDDADEDGYDSEDEGGHDCVDGHRNDDGNPAGLAAAAIHPGATETWYDDTDQDCNDKSDWDADSDGYDSQGKTGGRDCIDGGGYDDDNPAGLLASAVHPGATDKWYDGTDADCDDNDGDADGDGYYVDGYAYEMHSGDYLEGDCEDTDDTVFPGASEVCDGQYDDCDAAGWSLTGAPSDERDDDGDTYVECEYSAATWVGSASVKGGDDCDDGDATIYVGASELCDGQINNCSTAALPSNEKDDDSDGYVDCTVDAGGWDGATSKLGDDCDDADATVYPTATERCDGQYNDCDSPTLPTNESDDDGDHYVECSYSASTWVGSSSVTGGSDCDDADSLVYPAATERCDGQWNDCSNASWSATGAPSNETDDDADTYVECTYSSSSWVGSSSVKGGNDCNDAEPTIYKGATELCDGQINNCSTSSVPSDETDDDSDGYVDCTIDGGGWDGSSTKLGDDCDDADGAVNPGATEICDAANTDEDCDGSADDADSSATGKTSYYPDSDGDGYGSSTAGATAYCDPPSGYLTNHTDCRDTGTYASKTFPGAAAHDSTTTCMKDADSDDWGDENVTSYPGVQAGTDCDDGSGTVYPGAADTWYDGVDANCDDADDYDADADGYESDAHGGADCDDADDAINPDATEVCDASSVDEDCDGDTNEVGASGCSDFYEDSDSDGLGDPDDAVCVCSAVAPYTLTTGTDCDDDCYSCQEGDTTATHDPAGATVGRDDDCDGYVDEDAVAAGNLVFTELMVDPNGSGHQWFEVFNTTSRTLYLDGWSFELDEAGVSFCVSVDANLTVAKNGSLVFCEAEAGDLDCDYVYGSNAFYAFEGCAADEAGFTFDTVDGDILGAYVGATTSDEVLFDDGADFPWATGVSMQLDAGHLDDASNDEAEYWCESDDAFQDPTSTTQYGSPGTDNDFCLVPELTSVDPAVGLDAGGLDVTITGSGLSWITEVKFGDQVADFTVVSDSELLATTPAQEKGGTVDLSVTDGYQTDTLSAAFLYTGTATGIGWCDLESPQTTSVAAGGTTEDIFGLVYVAEVTDSTSEGAGLGISAQLGWGADGSDPSTSHDWTWTDAEYNMDVGATDKWMATITVPSGTTTGEYAYAYRFSDDDGVNYAYCHFDPGVTDPGATTYDPAQQGTLTVE